MDEKMIKSSLEDDLKELSQYLNENEEIELGELRFIKNCAKAIYEKAFELEVIENQKKGRYDVV